MRPLFTIGHSNHAFERFLALLRAHDLACVADVRSRPYSRHVPQYGRRWLERELPRCGLGYLYLGDGLGGTAASGARPQLDLPFRERTRHPLFQEAIGKLEQALRSSRTILLCRERDPLDCHRFHLVCRYLRHRPLDIQHVLPDGSLETQAAAERRMTLRLGAAPAQASLFEETEDDTIERAYERWSEAL